MHDDPLTHLGDFLIHWLYFHGAKISRLLFWHVTFLGETIQSMLLIRERAHPEYRHHPCRQKLLLRTGYSRIFGRLLFSFDDEHRNLLIDRKTEALCGDR
jgi:hypothetical protein